MDVDAIAGAAAAPFAISCALLAFAGAAKIRQPGSTRSAAAALRLPATPVAIRALGIVELGAALAGLAVGRIGAIAVALVFGGLTVAAWRLLARSPNTPCGCLGNSVAPVTASHVAVNVAAVIAASLAAGAGSPIAAAGNGAWSRVAFVVLAGSGAALVALLIDAVPDLDAAVREGATR